MEPQAKCLSVSETSSWRGKPLKEYSPLFGRLPASFQPHVNVDADGVGFTIEQKGTHKSYSTASGNRLSLASKSIADTESCPEMDDIDDEGHANLSASTVALVKSILGIGLVSMPYICSEVGIIPYVGFLIVFTIPSHFANICLAHSVELVLGPWNGVGPRLVDRVDYLTLGVVAFGSWAQWAILVLFLIVIWGGTVSLFIALWDILQGYVKDAPVIGESGVFVPLLGVLVFPLCCLDTMHALRHTSYFGVVGVVSLALSLAYWAGHSGNEFSEMNAQSMSPSGIALLPVFVFAYMGQFNFIRVYAELKRRSPARINIVSSWSLVVSFFVYGMTGIGGYWAFQSGTNEDIFKNYEHLSGVASHGARVLYAFSLAFTAPVFLFEARNMVEDIVAAIMDKRKEENEELINDEHAEENLAGTTNMKRRVIVVFVLLSTVVLVAVVYPHVEKVLGILGATTSTTMMMILPPAFLLRISKLVDHKLSWKMEWACKIFCISGFVCIPFFLGLVIWQLVDPSGSDSSSSSDDNANQTLAEVFNAVI